MSDSCHSFKLKSLYSKDEKEVTKKFRSTDTSNTTAHSNRITERCALNRASAITQMATHQSTPGQRTFQGAAVDTIICVEAGN